MVKYQSKKMGGHPDAHKPIGHTPYSHQGHEQEPTRHPEREGPQTVAKASDFLEYDEDTIQDPYARTRGTTNGYTPSNGSAGKRRQRGCGFNGIYLDEAAPRTHEMRNKSAQNPRRTGTLQAEHVAYGSAVLDQVPDFYYGASHPAQKRDPREPRKMDERFMTRTDKYEVDWEAKNTAADLSEVAATQLEEAAYARSEHRHREQVARQGPAKYDPWGTGTDHNPKIGKEITGAKDTGHYKDIPAMEMKERDVVPDDPYRDPTAERHNHVFMDATSKDYQEKWLDKGDPSMQHGDHRKVIELGGPTATHSQQEMVRTRFKEEAAGYYHAHDAHHKTHYLSGGRHFTDSGEVGPPNIGAGGELYNPQHARSKHNDFSKQELVRALDEPETIFSGSPQPRAHGLHGNWEENSIYSHDQRHHPFAIDRPNQTWN